MLKATIVYLPGSAGTMLYTILTLSEKTITGTGGADLQEYNTRLSSEEKYKRYLGWDAQNWKRQEAKNELSFKQGFIDFFQYENSELWLIDQWHALQFANMHRNQTLWGSNFYQWIIFIEVSNSDRAFLLKNQNAKAYFLDFDAEIQQLRQLQTQFKDKAIFVPFSSFFDQQMFLHEINRLDKILELELPMDLVASLWNAWFQESLCAWYR